MDFKPGDRVRVKDEHDIPAIFRDGKPTEGIVGERQYDGDMILVNVPIGDDDPDVHSQCVPYKPHMLIKVEG